MTEIVLTADAAMVLGIASTAMPFASSREAEVERWLRLLRLHGSAGGMLSALGISETPLEDGGHEQPLRRVDGGDPDVVATVTDTATTIAHQRGAVTVGTTDLLLAVMEVYGRQFDRVLGPRGLDRDDVLERLRLTA